MKDEIEDILYFISLIQWNYNDLSLKNYKYKVFILISQIYVWHKYGDDLEGSDNTMFEKAFLFVCHRWFGAYECSL